MQLINPPHQRKINYGYRPGLIVDAAPTIFLKKAIKLIENNELRLLEEENFESYFTRSAKQRFEEWCGYKISLVLPVHKDLPLRAFDALLTGQIPLVPFEIPDVDRVFSQELQESLPIIRFSMDDPDSLKPAYEEALKRFNKGGQAAALARHEFARDNHMLSSRMNHILQHYVGRR